MKASREHEHDNKQGGGGEREFYCEPPLGFGRWSMCGKGGLYS